MVTRPALRIARRRFPRHPVGHSSGMDAYDSPAARIVPYEDGPLIVRGDFVLETPDGERIDPGRRTVALCRCGKSAVKPFCDGTHKAVNFRAGSQREG